MRLTPGTGEIHIDGAIPEGTPDLISGGVFVISGAVVEDVVTAGPVTTYGPNDMVLDNWGEVSSWTASAPVVSHGPSGIGFVNFGDIDRLDVQAPIETTGNGARGFNLYDGRLQEARFASIATSGDGSIGIQISKPMGALTVAGDVTTSGSEGLSLVKGVQTVLKATALSVKTGGQVARIAIGGSLATSGDAVTTVEIKGEIAQLDVAGDMLKAHEHPTGSDHVRRHYKLSSYIDILLMSSYAVVHGCQQPPGSCRARPWSTTRAGFQPGRARRTSTCLAPVGERVREREGDRGGRPGDPTA